MRFSCLVISLNPFRGWFLQIFVQLPIDIMPILCTTPSGKLSHRSIAHHVKNHSLYLALNLALMRANGGFSSHFWQRKWAVILKVAHNYSELYQILPKFLVRTEEFHSMQLLLVQKPLQKKRDHPCCLSGPFWIPIRLRDLFISGAWTAFLYVHHFTYIYIAFHVSFYCPVTQTL